MADDVPEDLVTLRGPQGAETAPISFDTVGYEAYREFGDHGHWIVRVPKHVAAPLIKNGGFWLHEPDKA
jgi:hypothetical protein